jgi:hypothetical protein
MNVPRETIAVVMKYEYNILGICVYFLIAWYTGRKDEVEMLKEELVRKDRMLELTERKLKVLDGAYADMSEKYAHRPLVPFITWLLYSPSSNLATLFFLRSRYFVSVAVFAKMNATTEGYYCNIDVYQLYFEAQRLKVTSPTIVPFLGHGLCADV